MSDCHGELSALFRCPKTISAFALCVCNAPNLFMRIPHRSGRTLFSSRFRSPTTLVRLRLLEVSPTLAFERSARAAFLVQNGLITFFVRQSVRQMAVSGRVAPKSWRTQASTGKSPFSGLYNINSKYQIRTTEAPPIAALSHQPPVRTGCFHNTVTS